MYSLYQQRKYNEVQIPPKPLNFSVHSKTDNVKTLKRILIDVQAIIEKSDIRIGNP